MRTNGGFTFAEHPARAAPDARIIWRADLDPATLHLDAVPVGRRDSDGIDIARLSPWLSSVTDGRGSQHAILSDGWHHIRLEFDHGRLIPGDRVMLRYRLDGIQAVDPPLLALRRFLYLYRYRRFAATLFPRDRRVERWVEALRVHDALRAGASYREIGRVLFGEQRVEEQWLADGQSLRHRLVRLAADAHRTAQQGHLSLLRRR
uniref:DNA -binding domain-containing protein n=1 Tax=uncultured Sphingomonas sp. TaxID=158754 RepID=UPI0035CADA8F